MCAWAGQVLSLALMNELGFQSEKPTYSEKRNYSLKRFLFCEVNLALGTFGVSCRVSTVTATSESLPCVNMDACLPLSERCAVEQISKRH